MSRSRVLTLLLVAAFVFAGAPAARAATYCDQWAALCISGISYSPATVANTVDTTVTVTVTADAGKRCLYVEPPTAWVDSRYRYSTLNETSAGVYRGTFVVVRGARPGTEPLVNLMPCEGTFVDAAELAAAGFGRLTVTGTQDVSPPELTSLTIGAPASPVDVTRGPVTFPVTARITDTGAGSDGAQLLMYPHDQQDPYTRRGDPVAVSLTRTEGTANDGTYRGTATMPGGTSLLYDAQVIVGDRLGNGRTYTPADLTAKGLPSTVRTRTTAPPAKPSGLTVVTFRDPRLNVLQASAHWNDQADATEYLVTTSGNCRADPLWPRNSAVAYRRPGAGPGFCTVTVRASNAAGTSTATASGSAFL